MQPIVQTNETETCVLGERGGRAKGAEASAQAPLLEGACGALFPGLRKRGGGKEIGE